jgi:mannose-6-phosphate isomerase-like protein (cupin superfamily)
VFLKNNAWPMKTSRSDIAAYITLDGSEIRELIHPNRDGHGNQSLAEAIVPPGGQTHLHLHRSSEEIYHFISGEGIMLLGERRFSVIAGDSVRIAPGTAHKLINESAHPLKLLCICTPAYQHEDTDLIALTPLASPLHQRSEPPD